MPRYSHLNLGLQLRLIPVSAAGPAATLSGGNLPRTAFSREIRLFPMLDPAESTAKIRKTRLRSSLRAAPGSANAFGRSQSCISRLSYSAGPTRPSWVSPSHFGGRPVGSIAGAGWQSVATWPLLAVFAPGIPSFWRRSSPKDFLAFPVPNGGNRESHHKEFP